MLSFLKKNIEEIAESRILRLYGACLASVHVLTFYQWNQYARFLLDKENPMCWPFTVECHWMRVWSERGLQAFFVLYLVLASLGVLLFFRRKTGTAYILLSVLMGMKLFLTVQDYRFAGNYHYMPNVITLLFLFVPGKTAVIHAMLVAFYVAAGFLKLNEDWLSGAAMIKPPVLSGAWLRVACAYAVFFELIVVWGLLSGKKWLRAVSFGHAAVFHAFSWHIVGYFYPVMMGLLLTIFPMTWVSKSEGKLRVRHYAVLSIFAVFQLLPRVLTYDSAVTGEGRIMALNMFDAYTECEFEMVQKRGEAKRTVSWQPQGIRVRVQCDPIVYYNYAQNWCRKAAKRAGGFDLDISLRSKRKTAAKYRQVFAIENFCSQKPDYRWLTANSWIEGDK